MNPDTKKFLKIYFGIAFGVWLAVSIFLGPPGLSSDYKKQYKADHDRYLVITKSVPYKRYSQRPELNDPDMEAVPASLKEDIEFVQAYQSRPEYLEEMQRISLFTLVMRCYTVFLVVWIVWKLGKDPLLKLIDNKILEQREKLAAEQNAREAASQRKHAAEVKLGQVTEDENRILAEAQERLAIEAAELDRIHQQRLEMMARELEERKQEEVHAAMMRIKADLVNEAIDQLLKTYQKRADETLRASFIEGFTADLEGQAS